MKATAMTRKRRRPFSPLLFFLVKELFFFFAVVFNFFLRFSVSLDVGSEGRQVFFYFFIAAVDMSYVIYDGKSVGREGRDGKSRAAP